MGTTVIAYVVVNLRVSEWIRAVFRLSISIRA